MAEHTLDVKVEATSSGGGGGELSRQTATLRENIHTLQKFRDGGRGAVAVVRSLNQVLKGNLERGLMSLSGTFGKLAGPAALAAAALAGLVAAIKSSIAEISQAIKIYSDISQQGMRRRQDEFYRGVFGRRITQQDVDSAAERQAARRDQIEDLRAEMRRMEAQAGGRISTEAQKYGWGGSLKNKVLGWFGGGSKEESAEFKQRYDELKARLDFLLKADQMDARIIGKFKAPEAA